MFVCGVVYRNLLNLYLIEFLIAEMSRFSTSQFEDLIKKRLKCKNLDYMRFDYKDLSRVDPKVLAKGLFENNKVAL